MLRKKKNTVNRQVAIEVTSSMLRMVSVTRAAFDGPAEVHHRSLRWRDNSRSLLTDAGVTELTAAMKQLVREEQLSGELVRITLAGDYCVTRVLAGTKERVRRELANLEDRSQRYLSLGPGRKALAGSVRPIDARHDHALLTVSNQKTLDALVRIAAAVGVRIDRIEPSLVALCRVIGALNHDRDEPQIIVNLTENSLELGISYGGQLLLDYRPSLRTGKEDAADLIAQHLARLKRYVYRYFRFASGELKRVHLCGPRELVAKAKDRFDEQGLLQAEVLELDQLDRSWNAAGQHLPTELAPAVGTCLIPSGPLAEPVGPNLMEKLDQQDGPILRTFFAAVWPVAAVLLVALGLFATNQVQRYTLHQLQVRQAGLGSVRTESLELHARMNAAHSKRAYLEQISGQVQNPAWNEMLSALGGCIPSDAWLERMQLHVDGRLAVSGVSYTEDGVYEFVEMLKAVPRFRDVALEGTHATKVAKSDAVKFDVSLRLRDFAGPNEKGRP